MSIKFVNTCYQMVVFPRYLSTKYFFFHPNKQKKVRKQFFSLFRHISLCMLRYFWHKMKIHVSFHLHPIKLEEFQNGVWNIFTRYFYLRQKSKEINIFLGVLYIVSFGIIKFIWCVWHRVRIEQKLLQSNRLGNW